MTGRFQVLALDGGGAKALFTAAVLADLEQDHGIRIADCFDLIVGTSAGGIVALGLGAGLAPADILGQFTHLNRQVFPRRQRWSPRRLTRPAYRPDALRAALSDVLGDRLLRESSKRLVVPAFDVGTGKVHLFKTPHHPRFRRDGRVPMVEIAMATSAAPTFFPAHRCIDGLRLVDGGVWANNPSVVGIAEAISVLGRDLADVRVLSIGTTDPQQDHSKKLDRGGLLQWAAHAAPVVLTATSRGTNGLAEHLIGDRFIRFDATVPKAAYALDRIDNEDLTAVASSVSRELGPKFHDHFADHAASPFAPASTPGAAP